MNKPFTLKMNAKQFERNETTNKKEPISKITNLLDINKPFALKMNAKQFERNETTNQQQPISNKTYSSEILNSFSFKFNPEEFAKKQKTVRVYRGYKSYVISRKEFMANTIDKLNTDNKTKDQK